MAQRRSQEALRVSCSVCLEVLTDPVTIPCGHNYCQTCIGTFWDGEDPRGVYSCPQCRQTFSPRPVLVRNAMLAELAEERREAGPRENICSRHGQALTMFCRGDGRCICHLCCDEHRGHDIVSAAGERAERQKELQGNLREVRERIREREEELEDLNNPPYPQHPDRFLLRPQVLSKEALIGRCYWEVELSHGGTVAVAYRRLERSGEASVFGFNRESWALSCYGAATFTHAGVSTKIPGPAPSRVGVFLDHDAGVLSFYGVYGGAALLLHRVQTTFIGPLHAGIRLFKGSAELADV